MKLYLIYAAEGKYQGLHGMYNMDVVWCEDDNEADEYGCQMSYEVMESYSEIEDSLQEEAMELISDGWDEVEAYEEVARDNVYYTWCVLNDSHTYEEYREMTGHYEYEEIMKEYGVKNE